MTKRAQTIEVIRALDDGMERIQATRDIWQHELLYWICKGLKLLLEASLKDKAEVKSEVMPQPRMRPREIIDRFIQSGEYYIEIDISGYASLSSAYFSYYNCITSKRIKECAVQTHKGKLYLVRK